MRGAVDEDAARLARALDRPVDRVEAVLLEVGVDAPYLARALLDGDPQGALVAVSDRLNVPRRALVIGILRAVGAPPPGVGDEKAREAFTRRAAAVRRMPRTMMLAAVAAALAAVALMGVALAFVVAPHLYVELLLGVSAALLVVVAVVLAAASWRLARVALRLRRRM